MYKERSIKELLRFIFNKNIGVSDGFLLIPIVIKKFLDDIAKYETDIAYYFCG